MSNQTLKRDNSKSDNQLYVIEIHCTFETRCSLPSPQKVIIPKHISGLSVFWVSKVNVPEIRCQELRFPEEVAWESKCGHLWIDRKDTMREVWLMNKSRFKCWTIYFQTIGESLYEYKYNWVDNKNKITFLLRWESFLQQSGNLAKEKAVTCSKAMQQTVWKELKVIIKN